MLTRFLTKTHSLNAPAFLFSTKKQKMELTLRTPYKTYFENFDGFSKIVTKTNEAALVIQNKSPPSLYILPPGIIKVRLTQEVKGVSGELMHLGGWAIVHSDNTCEINLMDCYEKGTIKTDQFDKYEPPKEKDDLAGKYINKLRKGAAKLFLKKAI